jgi:WD40 repeat protein
LLSLSDHAAGLHSLAYSPDGRYIVTSGDEPDSSVKVWDAETGAEIYTLTGHPVRVWGLGFNPDSTLLATGGNGGVVKLWDLANGEELYTLPTQVNTVLDVEFSPDGSWLITGAAGGRIYDVETGEEVLTFTQAERVGRLALSRDGNRLYEGANSGAVRTYVLPLDEALALARSRLTRWFRPEECLVYLHLSSCPPEPQS